MTSDVDAFRGRGLSVGSRLIALVVAVVVVAAAVVAGRDDSGSGAAYTMVERAVVYNVDDAGVGDLDGDGLLDRWTTNHSGMQWVDLGGLDTEPGSDVATLGLWNDPTVPALEASARPIADERPGRVYFDDTELVVEGIGLGDSRVDGAVEFPWELTVGSTGSASASVRRCERADGVPCWVAEYSVGDGGVVRIEPVPPASNGFPVVFEFDADTDLDLVQLGAEALPPPSRRFTWRSRDRHGLAVATLAGESSPALFFSRGAARGRLAEVDPEARDELFEWRAGALMDRAEERGLTKSACPGRQTAWEDVDEDGLVDLYVVCGRGDQADVGGEFPNQLHVQQLDGTFVESASELGLDLAPAGTFAFVRLGVGCGQLGMIYATEEAVELHVRRDGRFMVDWSVPRDGEQNDQLVVTDLDTDGEWEALIFSERGNTLIELTPDGPSPHDLDALGLPARSLAGAVGDIDGDGYVDVVAGPQGVFRGSDEGFDRADDVTFGWAPEWSSMRLAIYDHDRDGDLDLWALSRDANLLPGPVLDMIDRLPAGLSDRLARWLGPGRLDRGFWEARLFENELDVAGPARMELDGPPSNPDGIGAVVEAVVVDGDDRRLVRSFPGITDSSLLSKTNLRIDLPLASNARVDEIRVHCVEADVSHAGR